MMSTRERQEIALRAAARTKTAQEHLAQAAADMDALSKDIGIRHHAHTAVKLAFRETESANAVMQQLVETLDQIRSNEP